MIPIKKGTPKAKSFYPIELRTKIDQLLEWFHIKFRPYSQHLFRQILRSLKVETNNLGSTKSIDETKDNMYQIEENAHLVKDDMEHIHESLKKIDEMLE